MRKVAGCLVKLGEKFLLVKRSKTDIKRPGLWEMPAGRVEEDETPEEGAIRELKEETNLDPKSIKLFETHEVKTENDHKTFYCYLVEPTNQNIKLSFEHTDFQWGTRKEALNTIPHNPLHHTYHFLKKFHI